MCNWGSSIYSCWRRNRENSAKIRLFANVYSYTPGAHRSIKGHHTFFMDNPEYVGAISSYMMKSGIDPDMYVMICGRVTPV